MAGVPFVFGNATTSIPLSNLDADFNTPVTIGNTTVGLGNTVTTLGNVTLTNVNIVSGTVPTANSIVNGTSNVVIVSSGGAVNIATNGTQAITVDTSQNVGIGTTTIQGKLSIQGDVYTRGGGVYYVQNVDNTNNYYLQNGGATGSGNATLAFVQGGIAERMRIDTSGNLLVGGTTSRLRLTVRGLDASAPTLGTASGSAIFGNSASNTEYGMMFGVASAGYGWIQQQRVDGSATAYDLALQPSGGNLLVGTTNTDPAGTSSAGTRIGAGYLSSNANAFPSAAFGRYTSTGAIVNINYAGSTVGSISYNGSLTLYNQTSDYRIKTVIKTVSDAGTRIDSVQPIEYELKENGNRIKGFLAHQFAEVYPNSVNGEKDAIDKDGKPIYQTMQASSSEVMADLISEIQSLRKRVATLEAK